MIIKWYVSNLDFRNLNSLFAYDEQDRKWYGTSPLYLLRRHIMQ